MLDPLTVYGALHEGGVRFYTGVPDSLLKDFCACVSERVPAEAHVIAANEGAAVALATGHHLATGKIGLVYMQNSGLGNAVNPLLSLADPGVYAIPMLLLIGWRGEPGRADEPQHLTQGRVTRPMLDAIGVEAMVLPGAESEALPLLRDALALAAERSAPVALVAGAGTFGPYVRAVESGPAPPMGTPALRREEAVQIVAEELDDAVVVSTTGMASRELFEFRRARGEDPGRDFLTVGSMGHASQIALGIALARPDRHVCCLDGDGALIMHMGALALIGSRRPRHFTHVVLNNGTHDSVGGQPTAGQAVDFPAMARACGYERGERVESAAALRAALRQTIPGARLIEVRVRAGARADLGRPTRGPVENKVAFAARLRGRAPGASD